MGRAGFAKVSVTPPLGVELAGYGVYLQRRATEVQDELFVRALMLDDDSGEAVLLLTLDLIGLSEELSEAIARQAAEAAGLTEDSVLVSSIHTHSGPATAPLEGWGDVEPSYTATIPGRCAEAASMARTALRPVRVGAAHGRVRALGFNRVRSDGPLDPGLHMLRIDNLDGELYVVLFSHGCHPVTIDQRTAAGAAISADWPGRVACRLQEEGCGEAIFRLGACGDIDPVVAWHGFELEGTSLSAEVVTQSLLPLLRSIETTTALRLRLAREIVELPVRPLEEKDIAATLSEARTQYGSIHVTDADSQDAAWQRFYHSWAEAMRARLKTQSDSLSVPLAALSVNGEAWLHLPGEIFTSLSQRIQERSPFPVTVVTTLAAYFIGYIPDRDDFASGGYASTLVPRILGLPPYSPAVGDALVDGAIHLLGGLA